MNNQTTKTCEDCGYTISINSIRCPHCNKVFKKYVDYNTRNSFVKKMAIGAALVVFVAVIFAIDKNYTRIDIKKDTFEAGIKADISDYVKPYNSKTDIHFLTKLDTDKIGQQTIEYQISYGIINHKKSFKVNVVDTDKPVIEGPDQIEIIYGDDFSINEYYSVVDFQKDIGDYLVPKPSISSLEPGNHEVELTVADSSGNESSKKIKVYVQKLSNEEHLVLDCINMYEKNGGKPAKLGKNAYIYKVTKEDLGLEEIGKYDDLLEYIILLESGDVYTKTKRGNIQWLDASYDYDSKIEIYGFIAREFGEKVKISKFVNKSL